jgi:hypothetical protein
MEVGLGPNEAVAPKEKKIVLYFTSAPTGSVVHATSNPMGTWDPFLGGEAAGA